MIHTTYHGLLRAVSIHTCLSWPVYGSTSLPPSLCLPCRADPPLPSLSGLSSDFLDAALATTTSTAAPTGGAGRNRRRLAVTNGGASKTQPPPADILPRMTHLIQQSVVVYCAYRDPQVRPPQLLPNHPCSGRGLSRWPVQVKAKPGLVCMRLAPALG